MEQVYAAGNSTASQFRAWAPIALQEEYTATGDTPSAADHKTLIIVAPVCRCDSAAAAFCRRFASRSTEESRSFHFRLLH
jgi:hypothetical protein